MAAGATSEQMSLFILFPTLANEKKWGQVDLDLPPGLRRGI